MVRLSLFDQAADPSSVFEMLDPAEHVMDLQVQARTGTRSSDDLACRNGYRERDWTRVAAGYRRFLRRRRRRQFQKS